MAGAARHPHGREAARWLAPPIAACCIQAARTAQKGTAGRRRRSALARLGEHVVCQPLGAVFGAARERLVLEINVDDAKLGGKALAPVAVGWVLCGLNLGLIWKLESDDAKLGGEALAPIAFEWGFMWGLFGKERQQR